MQAASVIKSNGGGENGEKRGVKSAWRGGSQRGAGKMALATGNIINVCNS